MVDVMKKKVLFVSNVTAGLVSFRFELIEKLVETCDVTIMASDNGRLEKLTELGCKFIPTEFDSHGTNLINELKLLNKYKRLIKAVDPDIVFTYTIKPNVYAGMACAALNIPYVANVTGLGTALENPGVMQKITSVLYKKGLKKAQKIFFQNSANRDFMVSRGIVKKNYDLIPGSGVNLQKFYLLDYPQGDTVDFTFISRVMKEKGIDQFLEAAEFIRNKYPNTRFHVCGNCEQAYEERLKELNDCTVIIYHGRIDDVAEIHRISACTIHPTYYPEGMSNVLLESCACGRPIITTNRPGCKEIVDDGINGLVVEEKNSQDLIEKIETFLKLSWEERRQMGLAGRTKVEKEFDRQIVIDKYFGELEKCRKLESFSL